MVFKCGHFKLQGSQNKERGSFLTTALLSWARSCQLQASGGILASEGLGTENSEWDWNIASGTRTSAIHTQS